MPDPNAWRPRARWPWSPPAAPTPPVAPSRAPDLAALEAAEGLTHEVAWAYAARTPDLLGPLRDAPGFRPLSLSGGRLLAAAFDAPLDPAWAPWLGELLHVQTDLPEVCAALPASVRSFHTHSLACLQALDAPERAGAEVWTGAPLRADQHKLNYILLKINTHSAPKPLLQPWHLPLLELAPELWLCWDRAEEAPCAVDTSAERLKHAAPQVAALPGRPAPAWVLPQDEHHPALLDAHSVLRGGGWAASVPAHAPRAARVLAHPDGRLGLLVPFKGEEDGEGLRSLLWLWTHAPDPERAMAAREASDSAASLATVERLSPGEARLRWLGGLGIYRLRGGVATLLNAPHAPGHTQAEPDSLDIALLPDDRLLIADANVMLRRGHLLDLALLAQDDARPGVEAAAHALHALEDCPLLVLTPDAWVEVDPAWQPRLQPILQPFDPTPRRWPSPFEAPCRPRPAEWILARSAAPPSPAPPPAPRWLDAAQGLHLRGGAFERLPCEPGLTVELTGPGCCFCFDGEAWQPVQRPQGATFLAEGELSFPEDAPCPAMQGQRDLWSLALIAAEHGRPHQARWLRLLAQQRAGQRVQGLADAAEAVSTAFKEQHKDASPGLAFFFPYPATEDDLIRHPERYDGVWVRYRGLVRSLLEQQHTAGAWFPPPADIKLPFDLSIAHVEGRWTCDGAQQGHFGQYKSSINISKYIQIEHKNSELPRLTHTGAWPPWRTNHPFRLDGHLHHMLSGWYIDGLWLANIHALNLPFTAEEPVQRAASLILARTRDAGLLLLEVRSLGPPEPLPPTDLPPGSPLPPLAAHHRAPCWLRTTGTLERRDDGWPLLNGAVRVVVPELSRSSKRHTIPDWRAPGLDRWAELLAAGPLHVELEGELGESALWAVRLTPTSRTPPASP